MENNGTNNPNGEAPRSDSSGDKSNKNSMLVFKILGFALLLTFVFNIINANMALKNMCEIQYSEFLDLVEQDKISKVEIQSGQIIITPDYDKITDEDPVPSTGVKKSPLYTGRLYDESLIQLLREHNVEFTTPIIKNNEVLNFFISWILPIVIMYLGLTLVMRLVGKKMGGGIFGAGKSNAKVYMQKETGVTFADVAGQDEAKESLEEIVDFLHNPDKYKKIGAKQPKGALLVGPPGTGKTLLARAVAGEADVTFMSISGSDFDEMYVGVGASRVRDLFKQASQNAPCIVFIDEIDAVGRSRNDTSGYNDQTLNQLLSEMDGFDSSVGVVLLAATNRPEVLDKALLRPGRFDRRVVVEKPDLIGRENILKVHAKNVVLGSDVDLHQIALATSGAVGADLANMVNEAALRAVRLKRDFVLQEDLMEAVEVVIAGKEKKDRILSDKEKKIVAYHEVGHALVAALQKNAQPVQKITIVPRTLGALGYTMTMPEDEKYLKTKEEYIAEITVFLAGRSAEEIKFSTATDGAANDIERASKMARAMAAMLGMSEEFDMMCLASSENRYLDGRSVMNCGSDTEARLDSVVLNIIKDCHKRAKEILAENIDALDKIAEFLVTKETITGEEFMKILNEIRGIETEAAEENRESEGSDENKNTGTAVDITVDDSVEISNSENKD